MTAFDLDQSLALGPELGRRGAGLVVTDFSEWGPAPRRTRSGPGRRDIRLHDDKALRGFSFPTIETWRDPPLRVGVGD